MSNWLDEVIKVHKDFETPPSFYKWGAITAVSAVLKDKVWINRYLYKLYPNIYTMIHAESGMKKGPAIALGKALVKNSIGESSIISGRSSIQGILKEMGASHSEPGGKVVSNTATFICSSELSSSIVDDPVATRILTDLYDRNYNEGQYRSLLKMESFSIKNPCITMLTATNEAMADEFFKNSAIKGGYIARTFIVHESKRNRINSLQVPPLHAIDYVEMAQYLKSLSKLVGPFLPTASRTHSEPFIYGIKDENVGETFYYSKSGAVYEEWYHGFIKSVDEQEIKDETGTLNRFGDSVFKVAMILSLVEAPNLEISESAMYEAINICEKLVGNVRKATSGKNGTSVTASLKSMIVMELYHRPNHKISKPLLMKKLMYHFSGESDFNDTMLSMENSGVIKIGNIGPTIVYEMPGDEVEKYRHLFEGKMKL